MKDKPKNWFSLHPDRKRLFIYTMSSVLIIIFWLVNVEQMNLAVEEDVLYCLHCVICIALVCLRNFLSICISFGTHKSSYLVQAAFSFVLKRMLRSVYHAYQSDSVLPCFSQERSKQERANLDIVWQLETKNKEIQTLSARIQKVTNVTEGNKFK